MLHRLRDALFRAISNPRGDDVALVRVPKDLARRLNVSLGQPLATTEELARRERARARLAALRAGSVPANPTPGLDRELPAPIVVYYEKDRNVRALERIEELLASKQLSWRRLDVSGDEATIDFVLRRAECERDELPVVFVADQAIGGHGALVRADVSGELAALADGTRPPAARS
jgi:hypothetical protein